ncbi:MAG: hypothetical protein IT378_19730 [Sandaracinaceae bacterium]|nr:hypothetical protein [Sandaracinaceae bacterium]MCC6876543.1 hypothetical protein [Sandaracinaceae bacterium]
MAKVRTSKKGTGGGRASAEAIEKRRAARQLNAVFSGGAKQGPGLDGRTEKRRKRLIKELKEGRGGKPLKPIDVVAHTHELLDLGETLSSLRKLGIKPVKVELTADHLERVKHAQAVYNYRKEAWRMLGVDVTGGDPAPRKRGAGKARKKKA